jgi:hypothetical protein
MASDGALLGRVVSAEPRRPTTDEWVVVEAGPDDGRAARPQPEPPGELVDEHRPTAGPSALPSLALDLDASGPLAVADRAPYSANLLEPEEGAKGSASSADRHPILPPPTAAVHLDGQLQPSSDEVRSGQGPSASSTATSDAACPAVTGEPPAIPRALAEGVPMLKVSAKKVQQRSFRLDADKGTLEWESKRGGTSEQRLRTGPFGRQGVG